MAERTQAGGSMGCRQSLTLAAKKTAVNEHFRNLLLAMNE